MKSWRASAHAGAERRELCDRSAAPASSAREREESGVALPPLSLRSHYPGVKLDHSTGAGAGSTRFSNFVRSVPAACGSFISSSKSAYFHPIRQYGVVRM